MGLFCVLLLFLCISKASLGKLFSYSSFQPTLALGWRALAWGAGCCCWGLTGFYSKWSCQSAGSFFIRASVEKLEWPCPSKRTRGASTHTNMSKQPALGFFPTTSCSSKDLPVLTVVLWVTGKHSVCAVWLRGTGKAIVHPAAPQRACHKW